MRVEISQSKCEFRCMAWLHIVVIVLLILNHHSMSKLLTGVLISFVCVRFVIWFRSYKRVHGRTGLIEISMTKDRRWFLKYGDGSVVGPCKLKSSTQLPYVLFIYLGIIKSRLSQDLMIPIDAVKKDDWRKLRAELRHPDSWEQ